MSSLPQNFLSDPPELLQGGLEAIKARNLAMARKIVEQLFDKNGKIDSKVLKNLVKKFSAELYTLSSVHKLDAPMREWMKEALQDIEARPELQKAINAFYHPVQMPYGDELLRFTLDLSSTEQIGDIHAKKAAVICLLTYFRQNVGSCFATAPAIKILSEQRLLFLEECQELLATGKLKRIVEGEEYAVPLSPNWGLGHLNRPIDAEGIADSWALKKALQAAKIAEVESHLKTLPESSFYTWEMIIQHIISQNFKKGEEYEARYNAVKYGFLAATENALLRSWEYTLASFSEVKAQFVGWNLYHSLGVDTDQEAGIGSACYRFLVERVEHLKKEVEDFQAHYEGIFFEAKTLESRVKRGSSQNETDWTLLEYRSRVNEMEGVLAKRDEAHHKAERLSQLYPTLIEAYNSLFPQYFQEIYDAGMTSETKSLFDDSPAGFRLLFKHGRTNPSAWTFIYNGDQFIQVLSQFFTMTETLMLEKEAFQGLEKELQEIVSEIIRAVRSTQFLEHAIKRAEKIHERGKPWEYVSGGSLVALLSTVYGPNNIKEPLKHAVESPEELLIFFIEALKDHPPKGSCLATSPTHAFVVKPELEEFQKAWNNSLYTYTWVRDHVFSPQRNFFEALVLDTPEIEVVLNAWPLPFKKELLGQLKGPMNAFEIIKSASALLKSPALVSHLESHLYNHLPVFPSHQLRERVAKVIPHLGITAVPALPERTGNILTAEDLRQTLYQMGGTFSRDPYKIIAEVMVKEGFAPPRAFLIADTNWSREFFAFYVGLQSNQLELVLSDYTGSCVRSFPEWRQYLDGRAKEPWSLYIT